MEPNAQTSGQPTTQTKPLADPQIRIAGRKRGLPKVPPSVNTRDQSTVTPTQSLDSSAMQTQPLKTSVAPMKAEQSEALKEVSLSSAVNTPDIPKDGSKD